MKSSAPQTDPIGNAPQGKSEPPKLQRRWLWLLLGVLLLCGGGATIWYTLSPARQQASFKPDQPPGVAVELSPVETGLVQSSETYRARLESRRSITLQPRVQGQITEILIRSGTRVPSGAAIIQIDPREQQAAFSSAKAAIEGAQSQVENAQATLKSLEADRLSRVADVRLNKQEYERDSQLAKEGAISQRELDQSQNRLDSAQASLNTINAQIQAQIAAVSQAKRALQQAQADAKEQQVQLQYYRITAPFTGTVGDIPVKVGDFVNTSTQLATITQNQPLEVNVSVPIERAPELRKGMPVEILNAQGSVIGTSKIFFISPSVINNTQSVLVKALFDNSKNQVRADESINARVVWEKRQGVLIPVNSVVRLAGESFVYVAQVNEKQQSPAGKPQMVARQRRVTLGGIQGNSYQILDGLKAGEEIIVSGLLNLRDGVPITPKAATKQ